MSFKHLTIEKREFERFQNKFKKGKFGTQRLGQAFYNHFNLHRLTNQEALNNVHSKDGETALRTIQGLCEFH